MHQESIINPDPNQYNIINDSNYKINKYKIHLEIKMATTGTIKTNTSLK